MNRLAETGLIEEIIYEDNFAYIVKDNDIFVVTEYKVLHNHFEDNFVKCMKSLYNGKLQLYYMPNGLKSLVKLLPVIDVENLLIIIRNFLASIIAVKNNGFLSCKSVDISVEHIFIEPTTYKVRLVYLPLNKRLYDDVTIFENELRSNLIRLIQNEPTLLAPKTKQLIEELANNRLSLEEIYNKMQRLSSVEVNESVETRRKETANGTIKIVALNAPVHFEIEITKDEFVLGRKKEDVDGVIPFNKSISRSHCKISRNGSQYIITDLKSSYGTYVNEAPLQANSSLPIKDGDVIRLSNSKFKVVIS